MLVNLANDDPCQVPGHVEHDTGADRLAGYHETITLAWVAVALLACIVTATAIVSLVTGSSAADNASAARSEAPRSITALGRVQPKDGVIRIAAPSFEAGPAIVTAAILLLLYEVIDATFVVLNLISEVLYLPIRGELVGLVWLRAGMRWCKNVCVR